MVKNIGKNLVHSARGNKSKYEIWVEFAQSKISWGKLGVKLLEFKSSLKLTSTKNWEWRTCKWILGVKGFKQVHVQLTLTLWKPHFNRHPDHVDRSLIPASDKLQLFE